MRKIHLVLIAAVALLSVAVFGMNLKLSRRNHELKTQLDVRIGAEQANNSPMSGWAMPPLKINRADGTPRGSITLQASAPKMVILLFDPANPVCDKNWEFWNQLLADPDTGGAFMPLTTATMVPQDYLKRFQLEHHTVFAGLEPEVAKQMRMRVTPQTIYMEHGVVKKVWFGLLSDEDLKEIRYAMKDDE